MRENQSRGNGPTVDWVQDGISKRCCLIGKKEQVGEDININGSKMKKRFLNTHSWLTIDTAVVENLSDHSIGGVLHILPQIKQ